MAQRTERIKDVLIEHEMKDSYLTFAMSVIVSRALPDVRDGLKPSQRRILVAMNDLNLGPRAKFRKCAKITGDTTGNYHPHGDQAVYMALVRMGQDFNYRYPLVDGQGNFGSMDGDPPAAMRYTEARMTVFATEMLQDITQETVDFRPNYDETRTEPVVLPGKFPCLLCNGTSGIAVGMATNMPPHNLREVCDAIAYVVDHPDTTVDDLMKIIQGPDFPGGALICGHAGIRQAYHTGKGSVLVRARCHVETTKSGKKSLVFTEIPYLINRENLIGRIGKLIKEGKLAGVADVRNESDRDGTRIVVDLRKGENEDVTLNLLYKHTTLQDTFGVNMVALVDNRPKTLNLLEMIQHYIGHRKVVIIRRTQYLLRRAEQEAHILEGLRVAIANIDEVIQIIKSSESVAAAHARLVERFSLSDRQAEAILQMRLQRLTALETTKIEERYQELLDQMRGYRAILEDENLVLDIIREDAYELRDKYGDDRRTEIVPEVSEFVMEDLIAEEMMAVTVSHQGYIKRLALSSYRRQHRGGRGVSGSTPKEGDFVEHLFTASTHDYILFFTNQGRVYWRKVYDIPQLARSARGRALVNLLELASGENVTSMIPVREFDDSMLIMVTRRGLVKRTPLKAFSHPKRTGIIAIRLREGDALIDVKSAAERDHVILASRSGQAIRFASNTLRPMGRATQGVKGISLREGDVVVGAAVVSEDATLLTVCEQGYGKRTAVSEYRPQQRAGLGLINIKTTDRNGPVVGILDVTDDDDVMMITAAGMVIRVPIRPIRPIGRNTMGVKVISLRPGDRLVAMARVVQNGDNHDEDDRS